MAPSTRRRPSREERRAFSVGLYTTYYPIADSNWTRNGAQWTEHHGLTSWSGQIEEERMKTYGKAAGRGS